MNTGKQLQQIFIITLLLFLLSGFVKIGAQTYISPGLAYGRWGINESPFYIQGDITIPDDSTLTIEPGVSVIFEGYYALNVQGRLLAIGSESSPITFNINDTTGFHKSDTTLGGWNGIQFIDTPLDNDTSKIIYCTLQYGKAFGSNQPINSGGAIFISNFDKVLISNCVIRNNSAGGLNSPSGGGLCLQVADIILENNEISYNHAWDGGGIQIWESDPVFRNNTIASNSADEGGGGIWIGGLSNCEFYGDVISNNLAGNNGGGIVCWQTTNTILNSVNFVNNTGYNGGAVCIFDCDLQLNECDIVDNASNWIGGGINAYNSTIEISNSNFERDTASVFGGAMGIYYSDLTISNSNLTDNSATVLGGGIHSDYSNINIMNTTLERDTTGDSGGGIFVWHCDLTLSDCDFNNNIATNSGGAISADSSAIMIKNSNFNQNSSIWGGGILHNREKIQLRDCLFTENSSEHGGALNIGFSDAELISVSFLQNSSVWGGGIDALNASIKIDSCMFSENEASNNGGAIQYQVDTASYINPYEFELLNSSFSENSSVYRGAIEIDQLNSEDTLVSIKIDKCEFINNSAQVVGAFRLRNVKNSIISNSKFIGNTTTQHTAVCTFNFYSKGEVYNCLFANNHTGSGTSGGVGISNGSEVNVMNCTFVNNSSSSGGGIHLRRGGTATVTNSIFWGNYPDQISLLAVTDTTECILYLNHNDIQYGSDSITVSDLLSIVYWGIGNIDSDPLFADTLNNDFHLQESSPCIVAGIDSLEIAGTWYYCPLTDLEGNPRPNPPGTMPDMGAYENGPVVGIEENISSINIVSYSLSQNFPNPFNPSTTFKYSIPTQSKVTIKVFDILGNEIETLVNEEKPVGTYELTWDAANLPSGVYFYKIKVTPVGGQAGSFVQTKKMILMK